MAEESLWPTFQGEPLDGDRTWSATFDSYDQYHDVCYYAIRIHRAGAEVASFTVKMAMDVEPTDVPAFRAKLAALAACGKTNTDHVAYALR